MQRNWATWTAFWKHYIKAELLPDSFRELMSNGLKTKHVLYESLNTKHNIFPWHPLEKKKTSTILLWLVTYLTAQELSKQIPAEAFDLHPQPWEDMPTEQHIAPACSGYKGTIVHGEFSPVRVVSSQLLLWKVEIWTVWTKWWFLKHSAFVGNQESAFPQWGI